MLSILSPLEAELSVPLNVSWIFFVTKTLQFRLTEYWYKWQYQNFNFLSHSMGFAISTFSQVLGQAYTDYPFQDFAMVVQTKDATSWQKYDSQKTVDRVEYCTFFLTSRIFNRVGVINSYRLLGISFTCIWFLVILHANWN